MEFPVFSIIIPSFNQGEYLEGAIQSVLEQDYSATELLVIDGGSIDDSVEIIKKYSDRLAFWVSEPDSGQSQAINKGFARASGEIITFLSSDDLYLPGAFADVAEIYKREKEVGAIVGAFCFWDPGQSYPGEPITPFLEKPSPCDLTLGPPSVYRLHQVSTFYTRSALDTVGRRVREDMKYVMDRELLYRVCRSFPVALSNQTYSIFRRHADSKSVADVLPFAREFGQLYQDAISGAPQLDHLRRKMAAYRIARGYVKYARAIQRFPQSPFAMIRAALLMPSLLTSAGYWRNFFYK
ncbi:MAG: glycosyltransferase family 2 protein [Desulfobacterales bacterium]|nr:glycosyltransferase family 2 protein [Desulfobacterales bacterium]